MISDVHKEKLLNALPMKISKLLEHHSPPNRPSSRLKELQIMDKKVTLNLSNKDDQRIYFLYQTLMVVEKAHKEKTDIFIYDTDYLDNRHEKLFGEIKAQRITKTSELISDEDKDIVTTLMNCNFIELNGDSILLTKKGQRVPYVSG